MKTRILKQINNRVKIFNAQHGYEVAIREKKLFGGYTEWITINSFSTFNKAIRRKHTHIIMLMRDLGYQHEFVSRRIKRKK
jgi:hypothetical protein